MTKITSWLKDLRGATAIEYALIAAGLALAISGVIFTLGDTLLASFQDLADTLADIVR